MPRTPISLPSSPASAAGHPHLHPTPLAPSLLVPLPVLLPVPVPVPLFLFSDKAVARLEQLAKQYAQSPVVDVAATDVARIASDGPTRHDKWTQAD